MHVITLPIIKNAKKPEDNAKNVFIGYFLTFMSYTICGILGYFGFSGTYFTSMPNYKGILSNCLLMFPPGNVMATIIRFCTFCQILPALCLMFACQRSQIYLLLSGDAEKAEKQSFKAILFTNVCILVGPFLFAIFYP